MDTTEAQVTAGRLLRAQNRGDEAEMRRVIAQELEWREFDRGH